MIEFGTPNRWRDLQNSVCKILNECGLAAETPKIIETVRGNVETDVYAVDEEAKPKIIYICECKNWNSRVPQEKVHAFRTVMSDFGANVGLMISTKGFQSGAYKASENTNVMLLDWTEFQNTFIKRWYKNHFIPTLSQINEPLADYTEPFNTRIFRKLDLLDIESQAEFRHLRDKYAPLTYTALFYYAPRYLPTFYKEFEIPELPLKAYSGQHIPVIKQLPKEILNATSYRDLLDLFERHITEAIRHFDSIFEEQA